MIWMAMGAAEVICFWHQPRAGINADWQSLADIVVQIRDGRTGEVIRQAALWRSPNAGVETKAKAKAFPWAGGRRTGCINGSSSPIFAGRIGLGFSS
ncbi:MAG: hypothetical protein R3C05_22960 [Pirellulaceae bacterium]